LLVGLLNFQRFLTCLFDGFHSLTDDTDNLWEVTVIALLLVDDFLDFFEERSIVESWVLGHLKEDSRYVSEVDVAIDVLIVQFLDYSLFQFGRLNVATQESDEHVCKCRRIVSVKSFDPLDSDWSYHCVEVIVDNQVVSSNLVKYLANMLVTE